MPDLLTRIHLPGTIKDLLYRTYERRLIEEIRRDPVPGHVGVIMDGNRRLARSMGLKAWQGHELGSRTLEALVDWSHEVGVQTLTLYAFSNENFDRDPEEVDALMGMFATKLTELASEPRIVRNQVRIKVLGRTEMLPGEVREAVATVEGATAHHDGQRLNFCIAYGARQEIIDAVRCIIAEVERGELAIDDVDEDCFGAHLYTGGDDPDLIIRTGGESRLSNFLLYQAAYSELYFTDVFFPAFRRVDFLRIIRGYQQRARRFGK